MRILMVTPEANPFARSGGLAEVISALSHSLARRGHQVAVVLPLYRQVRESGHPLTFTGKSLPIPLSFKTLTAEIFETRLPSGVQFYFIGQDALYHRDGLYGTAYGDFEDNAERFIFFSRAVVEMVEALELELDVCHCHEWQSGLVPVYCRTLYRERPRLQRLPIVYTVHNVGFQGIFSAFDLPLTGLGWELLSPKALEFFGRINLMKGGLVFADLLSTVSHKYREEILTPEQGFGLEGVFQERAQDLFGIVVGVDYERWDPARDPFLPAPYSPEDLSGKERCKEALLKHFGLTLPLEAPLFGLTTRLYERKGIDLLEAILEELFRLEVGLVLQGTGEERHQYILQEQALKFSGRFGLQVDYSEAMAHQIIAGADIFLMPSRYEPCGLDQLYCLRYGTIPVVRATGGLEETITAYNPETGEGSGFKFHDYTPEAFLGAIRQALALYADRPAWQALMRRNMALDFSWDRVAPQYEDLYRLAQDRRRQALGG